MSFEWHSREKHYALLTTRLEALTGLSFTGTHSSPSWTRGMTHLETEGKVHGVETDVPG